MARPGRLHVREATYFVVDRFRPDLDVLVPAPQRRNDSTHIRRAERNRSRFETLLDYACRRWCARVHAYCWTPDSALLLVQVSHVSLERVMHSLHGPFSHFLRGRGVEVPVYTERYRALLIDAEEYLLDFVRHIFWAPVKVGLCQAPLAYRYSSARVSAGDEAPAFLDTKTVAAALAASGFGSRTAFMRFLLHRPTPGFPGLLAHGSQYDQRIAGGLRFVQKMQQQSLVVPHMPNIEAVIGWVSERLGLAVDRIVGQSRYHVPVEARALVAWLATCAGPVSLPEVARHLSCGPSSLHRAIQHYLRIHPSLFNYETLRQFERSVSASGADSPGVATDTDRGISRTGGSSDTASEEE